MSIKNNKLGATLVEVLAVMIIGTMVSLIALHMVSNAVKTQKSITLDTQLRDEADLYILSLTNFIYTLHEQSVCDGIDTPGIQLITPEGTHSSYITTSTDCTDTTIQKSVTGFVEEDGSLELYVNNQKISGSNKGISIAPTSKMTKNKNVYKVSLTLVYDNIEKTFVTEIHSIK